MHPITTHAGGGVRLRALGAACLVGVAVTHLVDLRDKIDEALYMAVLFCGLITSSCLLAALLLVGRRVAVAWATAGTLSALTIVGYVLSRTVGLPQLQDHVGRWMEPAGIASLGFEAMLVLVAGVVAMRRAAARGPRPALTVVPGRAER
jgi:hypothetical protein